ncbi:hypothetical protein L3X38_039736 [Prunus dulcis]|uniref:Uncharacterized protein n=1 Tax=Prunus dulcis TaxID=3755 RepID=A0AAD4V813_PRUDU|nr:hypothetical protein L3X38_039736 [Prunus dulcis]
MLKVKNKTVECFFCWGTIHPLIPNMAFMGYLESVSNLHSSELRSIWLARLLDNRFKLLSVEQMLEQTRKEVEVSKKTTSDEICEEMGWTSWRKNTWLAEAFSPYGSEDYLKKQ